MQRTIDRIVWYHEFDFGNGLQARSTSDVQFHRQVWTFIQSHLDKIDFQGKTVLDIGCWDGYWSFYAERRGASHVLASDDRSQNWADGNGLVVARELLRSNVEVNQKLSIYRLAQLGRKFDVILCLGIYYHLVDPFYALTQVRHCCHDGTIVLVEGDGVAAGVRPQGLLYDLSNHSLPVFAPTKEALQHLCEACYLHVQSQDWMGPGPDQREEPGPGLPQRLRRFLGRQPPAPRDPLVFNRLFTVCQAFSGNNPYHFYAPPFGLHAYDERFKNEPEQV
jgi:tRNA (mo5U34)-methyltransferase